MHKKNTPIIYWGTETPQTASTAFPSLIKKEAEVANTSAVCVGVVGTEHLHYNCDGSPDQITF